MAKKDELLWSPDIKGKFHLGDLMYNLERLKEKKRKEKKGEIVKPNKERS
jgi:hypothetical protein